MIAIRDTASIERDAFLTDAEKNREKIKTWLNEQLTGAVYLRDTDNDPTDVQKRMGKALPVWDVEARLRKLVPQLRFEHTANPTKKYLLFEHPNGQRDKLMLYESGASGPIPEHSIMQAVIKESLDPAVVRGTFHLNRKDLPKHEVRPHEFDAQGNLTRLGGVEWDETQPILGMRRDKMPWNEAVRGYRTMCAFLVANGFTNPTAVEAVFGSSNTPEWAHRMGRRSKVTPW